MTVITFYSMPGCGYCTKARQMFSDELASGQMIEKPSSHAPSGTRGFPAFTAGSKSTEGLPQTKKQLYSKLGISMEGYHGSYSTFVGVY